MTLPLILTIAFVLLFIFSLCHAAKREPMNFASAETNEQRYSYRNESGLGGSAGARNSLAEAGIDWQSNAGQLPQSLRRAIKDASAAYYKSIFGEGTKIISDRYSRLLCANCGKPWSAPKLAHLLSVTSRRNIGPSKPGLASPAGLGALLLIGKTVS